jgi:hypothetical protein
MQPVRSFPDQGETRGIGLRYRLDDIGRRSCVGKNTGKTKHGVTRYLDLPRGGDALGRFLRALSGGRKHQIGRGDSRHLDVEIDAVERHSARLPR